MRKQFYQFAGVKFSVAMPEELFFEDESNLTPFRVNTTEADWNFQFEKAEKLLPPAGKLVEQDSARMIYAGESICVRYIDANNGDWQNASVRVEYRGRDVNVQLRSGRFPGGATANYVLICLGAEHLVARNNGFLFHCSYINRNGKAILFTAPSETGKTTQAELWQKLRGAEIVNGDRAAVRMVDGMLLAEGIPFSGSSQYCKNRSLPIEAVVYLGQAPVTSLRRLHGYEAFAKIWEGVTVDYWDKEDMDCVSRVVQKTAERIPVYYLPCTPDESAVIALEAALRKQVKL